MQQLYLRGCVCVCLIILGLSGCGDGWPITPVSQAQPQMSNLFPLHDGAVWQFQNPATGATLTITWSRYGSSFCGDGGHPLYLSTWTKSDPANYWMPGTDVVMYQLYYDDGTWVRSNAWWSNQTYLWAQDMIATSEEAAYPIMLNAFTKAGSIDAPYIQRGAPQAPQNACLPTSDDVQNVPWTTKYYQSTVETPFYKGPVIVSEQLEGPCTAGQWCNHELWSFAPEVGLVKIEDLSGSGINGTPVVNVRTH
jgi:hypothetical protein